MTDDPDTSKASAQPAPLPKLPTEPSLINPLLLSNFVHQIINPLNGVVGTLDNLVDDTTHPDRQKQRLLTVRAQLRQSIEMIRNLAFLAQLEGGSSGPGLKDVAVSVRIPQIIIEAMQFFQDSAAVRGIQLSLTDPTTQYMVPGHPDLLRQVFSNIFDNAVKYGDERSVVEVTPWPQKKTGQLLIEIRGRGQKFSQDEREKIFDLGYRGEEAMRIKASGAGIGLYLCRRILEVAHSASIEAEVRGTDQTVFRLRFPKFEIAETPTKLRRRHEGR